jgi:hypothetical protein
MCAKIKFSQVITKRVISEFKGPIYPHYAFNVCISSEPNIMLNTEIWMSCLSLNLAGKPHSPAYVLLPLLERSTGFCTAGDINEPWSYIPKDFKCRAVK